MESVKSGKRLFTDLRNAIQGKYICQFFEKVNGELLLQRQQVQGTVQATADLTDKFDFLPHQNIWRKSATLSNLCIAKSQSPCVMTRVKKSKMLTMFFVCGPSEADVLVSWGGQTLNGTVQDFFERYRSRFAHLSSFRLDQTLTSSSYC